MFLLRSSGANEFDLRQFIPDQYLIDRMMAVFLSRFGLFSRWILYQTYS